MLAVGVLAGFTAPSIAGPTSGSQITSNQPAGLASQGSASIDNHAMQTGLGGAFTPILPTTIPPTGNDPGAGTAAAPPYPEPGCPGGFSYLPPPTAAKPVFFSSIYPSFTQNATGGYDGVDAWFGYNVHNAVVPGGDAWRTDQGYPATQANIAGRIIGVPIEIGLTSEWATHAINWALQPMQWDPEGSPGTCNNGTITYGFGQAQIYGPDPPPAPPTTVLNRPPFGLGPTLLANVTGTWRTGTVSTLPGPAGTTRTYVHIPTCAWLDSGVPTAVTYLHAVTTAPSRGYTLFLVYNITVTPSAVTWDWGDGAQTTSLSAPEAGPGTLPAYDPAQVWTNPCSVSHDYATVDTGRTISATESFNVHLTVSWNDGVETSTDTVPCDAATGGDCNITIGPGQGWLSGPHPVDQIEPIPFSPIARG